MDSKIVADEGLLAKVRGVNGPTMVYDASGNAVAVVMSRLLTARKYVSNTVATAEAR